MTQPRCSYCSVKLEARDCEAKAGYGVFCREPVTAGEVLVVWGGDVITGEELAALPVERHHYALQVEENLYQIAWHGPEPADYVNHSCAPNAGLRGQVALVALRDIAAGEEVCYDYATSEGGACPEFECHCGAPQCRGRVTQHDWRRPELWDRYAGHFSPYLQRRIDLLRLGEAQRLDWASRPAPSSLPGQRWAWPNFLWRGVSALLSALSQ